MKALPPWKESQILLSVLEIRVCFFFFFFPWGEEGGISYASLCMTVAAVAYELCLYDSGILCPWMREL